MIDDYRNRIFCGDAANMHEIPNARVDFIFVDLPFNIDIGKRTKSRNKGYDGKSYEDDNADYLSTLTKWFAEAYRVLKPQGSIVCFSGWNSLVDVLLASRSRIKGFEFHLQNHCIIKYPFGIYTTRRYVSSHYHALWWTKHKRKWTFNKRKKYLEDVWEAKREFKAKELGHPCPTTVEWIKDFVVVHSNPGDLVLDFCMGSGSTAVACLETDRNYIGYEIEPEYVEIARKRVESYI